MPNFGGRPLRVVILQPCYIPWRGQFDLIQSADFLVFLDDVQYTKQDWRNRNRLKTSNGPCWLTVPVRHLSLSQTIKDTSIDEATDWRRQHLRTLTQAYARASHVKDAVDLLGKGLELPAASIADLDINLISLICQYLSIQTPVARSSSLGIEEFDPNRRLLDILKRVGATEYLSGPSAQGYLDVGAFAANGIEIYFKSYDYEPYPQLWGEFFGAVSVLDLIANCGPASRTKLRSNSPDIKVSTSKEDEVVTGIQACKRS